MPDYSEIRAKRTFIANNIEQICENIKFACSAEGKKFIMAYSDNPDGLLHKYGCNSDEAKEMILFAQNCIEKMCKELQDTLVIVCADHGHKDINVLYESVSVTLPLLKSIIFAISIYNV